MQSTSQSPLQLIRTQSCPFHPAFQPHWPPLLFLECTDHNHDLGRSYLPLTFIQKVPFPDNCMVLPFTSFRSWSTFFRKAFLDSSCEASTTQPLLNPLLFSCLCFSPQTLSLSHILSLFIVCLSLLECKFCKMVSLSVVVPAEFSVTRIVPGT